MNDPELDSALPIGEVGNIQKQNVTLAVERLLSLIDQSDATEAEKVAAKSKFMGFVNGVIKTATEGGVRAVIEYFKG